MQADVSCCLTRFPCLCFMLCVLSVVSGSDLQLQSVAEVKRLTPNSSVFLSCQVTGPYDPWTNQILWTKRFELTPSDQDGTKITSVSTLNEQFRSTGRHAVVLNRDNGAASLDLSITG